MASVVQTVLDVLVEKIVSGFKFIGAGGKYLKWTDNVELDQNLKTTDSPTFGGATIGSGTGVMKVTEGVVGQGDVDLTSEVTGVLPLTNGGTGALVNKDEAYQLVSGDRITTSGSGTIELTLPTAPVDGDVIEVISKGQPFKLVQNALNTVRILGQVSVAGATGYVQADQSSGAMLKLLCIDNTNGGWLAINMLGTFTIEQGS